MAVSKKVLAKKYQHKVEDKNHIFYEPERLIQRCRVEGKTEEETKSILINYIETERQKCVKSIEYFAETYGFITGPGGAGIIPMHLEKYQKTLLKSFVDEKYIVVVKARQLGVSTSLMFYALWFSIFSTGKRCLVVAHRKESAEEFITKLKTAYEFLPEWLKPSCVLYSKNTVEFDTKSTVKAITSNPNAARSFSATLVLLDEAGFVKECDEVVKAIGPTVAASDGKLIAISTPNGNSPDNWFYKTVTAAQIRKQSAEKDEVNWRLHELPWTVSSIFTRNPNFRRDQIRLDNGNEDKFKQEYECFMPGTTVLTTEGMRPIETLSVGDMVISHSGRARKVTATMNKFFSGNLSSISSYGTGAPLVSTPEHPIRTYNKEDQTYSWVSAKDIQVGNKVVFPKAQLGTTKVLSQAMCMLLAWYICEGSGSKNQFQFSLRNEESERDRVCNYLDTLNIQYTTRFSTGWQVIVNDCTLADFFKASCGNHSSNKRIPFGLISGWENEFFDELMMGDGCYIVSKEKKYSFHTISKSLAYQVQLLANSLDRNYAAGVTEKKAYTGIINDRHVNYSHSYSVQIFIPSDIEAKSNKLNRARHGIAAYVTKVEEVSYTGLVYNISVQHDESYIVDGRAVHNCCFDINLFSLFDKSILNSVDVDSIIINKTYGGATYEDTLYMWSKADPTRKYIMGVDCASNKITAKDYSSFQVIDQETHEQCAEYIGKLPTEVFVDILIKLARHYNNAMMVIESNSYSEMVFYLLEQKRYANIWYDPVKNTPGFQTNRATRSLLIEKLLLFYNNPRHPKALKSARLRLQMENFTAGTVYSDGSRKSEAKKGNDDAVMALALAVVTLTPKEHIHRPHLDSNLAYDARASVANGEYSDEYLEYHSEKMGISKEMLNSRLRLYHRIKSGDYDGSGIEDLNLQHPVEEYEKKQAAEDLIGHLDGLVTDSNFSLAETISLIPSSRKFTVDDIFSDEFRTLTEMHSNFLFNRNR